MTLRATPTYVVAPVTAAAVPQRDGAACAGAGTFDGIGVPSVVLGAVRERHLDTVDSKGPRAWRPPV